MAYFLRYLTTSLISAATMVAIAQAEAPSPDEIQLVFTVFSSEPVGTLCYIAQPGAKPSAMVLYPTARSQRYPYCGPSRLRLRDSATGAVRAEVDLPRGIRRALLIFSARTSTGPDISSFRVHILDDSSSRHAPGKLMILNLSGLDLAGTINRQSVALDEGLNGPFGAGGLATINLRTPFRDRSYQAFAETVAVDPSGSTLLLLFPPYRNGSLEVQSRLLLDDTSSPAPDQLH